MKKIVLLLCCVVVIVGSAFFIRIKDTKTIQSRQSAPIEESLEENREEENYDNDAGQYGFDILYYDVEEVSDAIDEGMSLLYLEEYEEIGGQICYLYALGTSHPEQFVRERLYAVGYNPVAIYRYEVMEDAWIEVAVG